MKRHLLLLMALLALPMGLWAEEAPEGTAVTTVSTGVYRIVNRSTGKVMTERYAGDTIHVSDRASELDYNELWVVEKKNNNYRISNVRTAGFAQNTAPFTTTQLAIVNFTITSVSGASGYFNVAPSANTGKYMNADGGLVKQGTSAAAQTAQWQFEKIASISASEVRSLRDEYNGWETPTDGNYYTIYNLYLKQVITTPYGASEGKRTLAMANEDGSYSQIWKIDGKKMQSLPTGDYIQTSAPYYTSSNANANFTYTNNSSNYSQYLNTWFVNANGTGMHAPNSGGSIVGWGAASDGSNWIFKKQNVSDEQIAAAKEEFETYSNLAENTVTITEALKTYFNDNACSSMKDNWKQATDEELTASMTAQSLPQQVIDMALKVKNNTWEDYEKEFRINDYMAYSDPNYWADQFKSATFSRLNNPTGVHVKKGQTLMIFVDTIYSGTASMQLELVGGTFDATGGSTYDLKKGMNVVYADRDGATYIFYKVNTTTNSPDTIFNKYPNVNVHIEGGYINGVIDVTRMEDWTDDQINAKYADMKSKGLFTGNTIQLKNKYITFNLWAEGAKEKIGTEVSKMVRKWEWILENMYDLAGMYGFDKKWRCQYGSFTTSSGTYAFATSRGTFYSKAAMGDAYNYNNFAKGTYYAYLWTIAHENGHNLQRPINCVGMTEVSNNLFSNLITGKNGRIQTVGHDLSLLASNYNKETNWMLEDGWLRMRMYYQLYIYFHQAKKDTTFYPRLFQALRDDPMPRNSTNTGTQDYLKFALKCCEIANADLSDFFRAWGFFIPISKYYVNDYGDFTTTTTKAEINAALRKMQKYEKKITNIFLIEDRVKAMPALYDGHKDGEMIAFKQGEHGDVGQFDEFYEGSRPQGYTYQRTDSVIKINYDGASGAVGFKVLKDGEMIAFSNQYNFNIPSKYADDYELEFYAAGGDNVDQLMSEGYSVYVYPGNEERIDTLIAAGVALPTNWVAKTKTSSGISDRLKQTPNVIVGSTCENMVISDGADFYVPSVVTANNLTYTHSTLSEYSPVCLPFAIKSDDLPFGSEICKMTAADGTTVTFTADKDAQTTAGHPFVIYSAQAPVGWSVTKTKARVVKAPVSETVDGVTLYGTFVSIDGQEAETTPLLPNADCTLFTQGSKVEPMRIYLTGDAASYNIVFQNTGTGISEIQNEDAENKEFYDLSGRRITSPAKAGIYILNGKKVVKQ